MKFRSLSPKESTNYCKQISINCYSIQDTSLKRDCMALKVLVHLLTFLFFQKTLETIGIEIQNAITNRIHQLLYTSQYRLPTPYKIQHGFTHLMFFTNNWNRSSVYLTLNHLYRCSRINTRRHGFVFFFMPLSLPSASEQETRSGQMLQLIQVNVDADWYDYKWYTTIHI